MAGPETLEPQTETTESRVRMLGTDLMDNLNYIIGNSGRDDLALQQSIVMQAVSQAIDNLESLELERAPSDQAIEMALLEETRTILRQWTNDLESGTTTSQMMEWIDLTSTIQPSASTFDGALEVVSEETSMRRLDATFEWFQDRARNNIHTTAFGYVDTINGIIDCATFYAYLNTEREVLNENLDTGDTLELRRRFSQYAQEFIESIIYGMDPDLHEDDERLPDPDSNMHLYTAALFGIRGAGNESRFFLNEDRRTLDHIRQGLLFDAADIITRNYSGTMDSPAAAEIYELLSEYIDEALEDLESRDGSTPSYRTIRREVLSQMREDIILARRRLRPNHRVRNREALQYDLNNLETAWRIFRMVRP